MNDNTGDCPEFGASEEDAIELAIARFLDGTASEGEIQYLNECLKHDPKVRRAYFLAASQDASVRDELASLHCDIALAQRANSAAEPAKVSRSGRSRKGSGVVGRKKSGRIVPSRRRWAIWSVAASVLLACAVGIAVSWFGAPYASVTESDTGVEVLRGGRHMPAPQGTRLEPNDTLLVPDGDSARIEYKDTFALNISPDSALFFGDRDNTSASESNSTRLFLQRGILTAKVSPMTERQVVFYTPDTASTTSQTDLKLRVEKGRTQIDVRDGEIRLIGNNESLRINAGNFARLQSGSKTVLGKLNTIRLQDGLVGHWMLDGSGANGIALDSSPNANHAKIKGAGRVFDGQRNSLRFDEPAMHVSMNGTEALNITRELTMSCWIKVRATGRDQKIAGLQDEKSGGYKLSIFVDDKVDLEIRDKNNHWHLPRSDNTGTKLRAGLWYHIVGVYSCEERYIHMYVDGKLDREKPITGVLARSTGELVVGTEPYKIGENSFQGCIADLRIYDRILNDAEIKYLAGDITGSIAEIPRTNHPAFEITSNPNTPWRLMMTPNGHFAGLSDTAKIRLR